MVSPNKAIILEPLQLIASGGPAHKAPHNLLERPIANDAFPHHLHTRGGNVGDVRKRCFCGEEMRATLTLLQNKAAGVTQAVSGVGNQSLQSNGMVAWSSLRQCTLNCLYFVILLAGTSMVACMARAWQP